MPHRSECLICSSETPSDVIAEGTHCWVTAPQHGPLPGYVCIVFKKHAVEPFDLPLEQQAAFWFDVCAVARAVRDAVEASKVNYEIHGNTIAHLHLHVFPRYPNDPYTGGPIDGASRQFHRSAEDLHQLTKAAESALGCAGEE